MAVVWNTLVVCSIYVLWHTQSKHSKQSKPMKRSNKWKKKCILNHNERLSSRGRRLKYSMRTRSETTPTFHVGDQCLFDTCAPLDAGVAVARPRGQTAKCTAHIHASRCASHSYLASICVAPTSCEVNMKYDIVIVRQCRTICYLKADNTYISHDRQMQLLDFWVHNDHGWCNRRFMSDVEKVHWSKDLNLLLSIAYWDWATQTHAEIHLGIAQSIPNRYLCIFYHI